MDKKTVYRLDLVNYIGKCIAIPLALTLIGLLYVQSLESYATPAIIDGQYVEWYYHDDQRQSVIISDEPLEEAEVVEEGIIFVPFDSVPLSADLQELLWRECEKYGIDYAFALGTIQLESEFNPRATNHNSNGSTDRGLCQVNSCWIKKLKGMGVINTPDDLYDPATNIVAGMWELGLCVAEYGNTERAYAMYNTGSKKVRSNKASRAVWKYKQEWDSKLIRL